MRNYLSGLGALDPRALACWRIGLAGVVLWDIGLAWPWLEWWPGLQGYEEGLPLPEWLRPAGDAWTLRLAFGAWALLAVGMLLGWRARLCTLGVWLGACGHQFAAGHTADYHDALLVNLLLWAPFVDAARVWSVDAWRGRPGPPEDGWARVGGALLVLNLAFVYLSAVLHKSGPAWRTEGTALYFALADFAYSGAAGWWLADHVPLWLWRPLTWAVLVAEGLGALLLVSPWRTQGARMAGCALLMGLQAGIWVCMDLASFPATALAANAALLPVAFWERAGVALAAARPVDPRSAAGRRGLALLLGGALFLHGEGHRLRGLDEYPYAGAEWVRRLHYFFGLELSWQMYSPEPPAYSGWWVGLARSESGREIDPITGARPALQQPQKREGPFAGLGTGYWLQAPRADGWPHHAYARFLLWKARREGSPLSHLQLLYLYEPFLPPGLRRGPYPLRVLRWPEDGQERPPLPPDSALRGIAVGAVEFDSLGAPGWEPETAELLQAY